MSISQYSAEWEEDGVRKYRYFTRKTDALEWAQAYAEAERIVVDVFDNKRDRDNPHTGFDGRVTAQQQRDFYAAHVEGLHDEAPREFCQECDHIERRVVGRR